jgi:hypothetical protein
VNVFLTFSTYLSKTCLTLSHLFLSIILRHPHNHAISKGIDSNLHVVVGQLRIPLRTPTNLTEVFRGLPTSLQSRKCDAVQSGMSSTTRADHPDDGDKKSSETSANFRHTTRLNIPEDSNNHVKNGVQARK